jgi:hypothetical protein
LAQYFKTIQAAQALQDIVLNLTRYEASAACGFHDDMMVQAR